MLALQKSRPDTGLALAQVPKPKPGAGEVLIAVHAVGICGSDVHIYDWSPGYESFERYMPFTVGHEFAGTVTGIGEGVTALRLGDRVTVSPSIACGRCQACVEGQPDDCENKSTLGFTRDGAFAGYVTAPSTQCLMLPDSLDFEVAALAEPLCVGARAVEVGDVRLGHHVLVLGAGMIGLAIALMARRAGAATVILAGKDDAHRLGIAQSLGFQHTVDLAHQDLAEKVQATIGGKVDRVFEATGVPASVKDGLANLRRNGVLVVTGIHSRPLELNVTELVRKKHQLRGSHAATRATWVTVLRLLAQSPEEFRPLITHRIPLADGLHGFALMHQKAAVKVIMIPDDHMLGD